MRADSDANRLSLLVPQLRADGWEPPPYLVLWRAALDAVIPAEQINGRWHYRTHDVPAIAKALRLRKRPGAKPAADQTIAA